LFGGSTECLTNGDPLRSFVSAYYKVDRTVPDRRKYALTVEKQASIDEEELGYLQNWE